MMQHPIGESELIVTPQGCIYHLDLHPEELAPTVILVGDPGRVAQVSRYFDSIEHKKSHREFITHTGYIGTKRISVLSTGIGTGSIDIVINELDALMNIDFATRLPKDSPRSLNLIKLGTCGSLQPDIPADSLVVSTFGIGLDNLLHYYRYEHNAEETFLLHVFQQHCALPGNPVQPYIAASSVRLRNHFSGMGYMHGITVTCPGFYAPQGRRLRLSPAYTYLIDSLSGFSSGSYRIANFEMETAAIYGLGKLLGHQCISINTVIADRRRLTFTGDLPSAVDRMIRKALEAVETL